MIKAVTCSCLWKTCFPVHSNWPDSTDLHPQLCNYLNIKKKPLSVLSLKGYTIMKTGEEWILQAEGFLGLSHVICLGFISCFLLSLHCGLEPLLSPKEQDLPSSIECQMIWILKVTFEWLFEGSFGESHPTWLTFCFNCFCADLTQYRTKAV